MTEKQILPERDIPTPFGKITLPSMMTPRMGLPRIDSRRGKALSHATATDLTGILSYIPYVGSLLGGQISDLHYSELRKLLTDQELERYIEADRRIPSNGLALLYSFVGR